MASFFVESMTNRGLYFADSTVENTDQSLKIEGVRCVIMHIDSDGLRINRKGEHVNEIFV